MCAWLGDRWPLSVVVTRLTWEAAICFAVIAADLCPIMAASLQMSSLRGSLHLRVERRSISLHFNPPAQYDLVWL